MLIFRWMIPVLLLASGVLFAFFMVTGNPRYKRYGLHLLLATLVAAFGFFAALIAINLLE